MGDFILVQKDLLVENRFFFPGLPRGLRRGSLIAIRFLDSFRVAVDAVPGL